MKVRILSSLSLISIMFGLLFGIPVQVEASTNAGVSVSNDLVEFLGLEGSWVDGIDQAYLVTRGIEGDPIGCDTPGTPVLISPTDASTISDNTPTFNWEIASSSYEYQIQVDNNPDFPSSEIDTIVFDTNYTPGTPLSDDTYHWHVRGHNTGGECNEWGDWSDAWTVTIDTTIVYTDFSADPISGIASLEVSFTNESTGDYDTCSWDFGDGGASPDCSPAPYIYITSGVYTVTLTASGIGGEDTEIKPDYITVYEPVVADFSGTPTSGPAPLEVTFTNESTGDYDTCSWDFGDGGTSSDCSPAPHTYIDECSTYTVSLTASGNGGEDTETKTSYISTPCTVEALFSATPTSGIASLEVSFTDQSTGDYDTCSWNFGDGGTSAACSPTYHYNIPGVYTVSLTVSGIGGEDTETKPNYITVYTPVEAQFSGTPTSGIAPLEVSFTDLSTGDYDTCSWDFGDGGTSSDCSPAPYTYIDACGTYTVSLTVSGNGGEDTETKTGYISTPCTVEAEFSATTPTSGIAPLEVSFTNESTGDYDTCSWDFGDGGMSSDCSPAPYTFNTHGSYTVTLTVSGNGGEDTEIKPGFITVYEPVVAAFSAIPTELVASGVVTLTNESTGDFDTCSWDFGDGGTSSVCSTDPYTYTYNSAGIYTVSLTVSGNGGEDTETKTDYITVYTLVEADFSTVTKSGPPPLQVSFTNLSMGDYDTCSWDFGDGGTSSDCSPEPHTYNSEGTYTVTLTVSGNGGQDTETKVDFILVENYRIYTPFIFNDNGL